MNRLIKTYCGYYQVKNKPTQSELNEYYSNKYYQEAASSYEIEYSTEELNFFIAKIKQKEWIVNKLLGNSDKNNIRRMLDVGCGEGFALQYFNKQGWSVKGLDFSSDGIVKQNPDMERYFIKGDIYKNLSLEINNQNKYDVVWLQNVLEHVLEPEELLFNLKRLINPSGVIVITVPNDFSSIQKSLINSGKVSKHYWIALPDHISYFNYLSLENILNSTGWKTSNIIADFPIDWFLANNNSNYIEQPNIGKSVHATRVFIEDIIDKQSIDNLVDFYKSLAKIGMGRCLTAFAKLKGGNND